MEKVLPLKHLISFDKFLRHYDRLALEGSPAEQERARLILRAQEPYPILRDGFTDVDLLEEHQEVLEFILSEAFAPVLGDNEIKALSLPYRNVLFNPSRRLRRILNEAGPDYLPVLKNKEEGFDYIIACTIILKFHFGYDLDFSRPYYFEIPDSQGVKQYYRVMYNADFMEIFSTVDSPEITPEDVDELLSRPEDLEFWKSKIPPGSFEARGFVIANLFNVTNEYAISAIKSELIAPDSLEAASFFEGLQETVRSFFRLKELRIGLISYNQKQDRFERPYGNRLQSFLLPNTDQEACDRALCEVAYDKLLRQHAYFVIPDVEKYLQRCEGEEFYHILQEQGIQSAIFAPIADNGELLGVLELVSTRKNALNGVNATKLDDILPYMAAAAVRASIEEENLIDAIIQHECTTVHDSVLWKFKDEARRFMKARQEGREPTFGEISLPDIYPLYGQIDIQNSAQTRNEAVRNDLLIQLSGVRSVLQKALEHQPLPVYEELVFRVGRYMHDIGEVLHTNSEQVVFNFVQQEVMPVFQHLKSLDPGLREAVLGYEAGIDPETHSYYDHRKNFDQSLMRINKSLTYLLDQRQEDAQKMFPHYFERYRTDGVEHTLYIGESIAADGNFDLLYLRNLRLWQLQVMCEMENAHYHLKPQLPVPLDVTSLVLVYNTSISVRFRMDEKRFDVDGAYNARYEILKKRIDKSMIRGTRERLTQAGKLVIVYSQKKDEQEYLRYIAFLKARGYFTNNIEIVDVEDLQGVSGLKAIRAEILYRPDPENPRTYTYADLMKELEA